jgi:1,2-alpha-glucosylglycerol phosphorylase
MHLGEHVRTDTGWEIIDRSPTDDRIVTIGSNFGVGNGYLFYRGTRPDHTARELVGCIVSDTYDMADGVWRELCTVPNALFASIRLDGEPLRLDDDQPSEVELRCATGEMTARWTGRTASGDAAHVSVRRFAGLDQLHLVRQQVTVLTERAARIEFSAGVDTEVWSLNGDHFASVDVSTDELGFTTRCVTRQDGTVIAVVGRTALTGPDDHTPTSREELVLGRQRLHRLAVDASAGHPVTLDSVMVVATSNDDDVRAAGAAADPAAFARTLADAAVARSYVVDLAASADRWTTFWDNADVVIDGDTDAQAALRFSILHNRVATPAHSDRLPIGARGLSCQAYQGAAFWDQEMFNLPAFLFTAPDIARNILVYRWRTLDGARRKARRLGYQGAYYAWISGDTGDELCPDFFFTDVLTGRPIRNHFNVWQMHVSPDIAVTTWRYWEVTADLEFMEEHGAEIIFEVARFLHSFVKYDEVKERYEVIRLLGPDEWHENVDNDVYTNRLVQLALAAALDTHTLLTGRSPARLAELHDRLGLTGDDVAAWQRVHDRLYVPQPDPETGLIEQFDGFFALEDVRPDELRGRLLDPTEYWGWPNGVAVHTQVSKQPAVVQLFAVDGTYPPAVQRANYDYYEPRCAHGSSLSHSVHATVAAHLSDDDPRYLEQAYEYFMDTATVDLAATQHESVGGTFIGGMHTAANAGAYGTAVFGFGGLRVDDGVVLIEPRLPGRWRRLSYQVVFRDQRLNVEADHDATTVNAATTNTGEVPIRMGRDAPIQQAAPGQQLRSTRRGT